VYSVLLLGAGKIGRAIAKLLSRSGDFDLLVGDAEERALLRLEGLPGLRTVQLDVEDPEALAQAMVGRASVVSACSFALNAGIARAALLAGASYFDLTEDIATTRAVREIAAGARSGQIFVPQCGLAPGFIGIAGHDLSRRFDELDEVRLRVGALSLFPSNELKYNLTWSTDGLINEYCNPCEVIHDGRRREVLPLEGVEQFSLDGVDYEAFHTSGGLGTLAETLEGQVRALNYKTVRYPGHRDRMTFLIHDLRLGGRRAVLKEILENAVPITLQDVVLIVCTVTGWVDRDFMQVSDVRKIYHADVYGEPWSAIQIATAGSLCAVLDLHRERALPDRGFVRQEEVGLGAFLANRFGRCFEQAPRPGGWRERPAAPAFIEE
jgi:saccharopine dehydrogenase-like NADP-dependent oxidoreductase